jgi:hypothetical protein
MITAPSALFEVLEGARLGTVPEFRFAFFPHFFDNGVGDGEGTFDECAWEAPDVIRVTTLALTPSWTSAALTPVSASFPTAAEVSWEEDDCDIFDIVVEVRTAKTATELAGASWTAVGNGDEVELREYFQVRVTWDNGDDLRCLALDTEDPTEPRQAYAIDSLPDDYASYAVGGAHDDSYLSELTFKGEYALGQGEVADGGELRLEAPLDFAGLVAPDHTLLIYDAEGRFDPKSANFIWADDPYWGVGKYVRIRMGFARPGVGQGWLSGPWFEGEGWLTGEADPGEVLLYEGIVREWHRREEAQAVPEVEVYSQGVIAACLQQPVGAPGSDGTPNPEVYGTYLIQAQELGDVNLDDPKCQADFETGDLSQLQKYAASGGGAVTVVTTAPKAGTYCCRTAISAAASAQATGSLVMPAAQRGFASGWMRLNSWPTTPEAQSASLWGLKKADGTEIVALYPDNDGRLWVKFGSTWEETDCYLGAIEGFWVKVSAGLATDQLGDDGYGVLKLWVDGNEIWSKEDDWSTKLPAEFWFGVRTGGTAETWSLDWDEVNLWNSFHPVQYQAPGGPFERFEAVYVDGVLTTRERRARTKRQRKLEKSVKSQVIKASKALADNYYTIADRGWLEWLDFFNAPSGEVMIMARKNDITHPADVMEELLTNQGLEDRVDAASFAAAKSDTPDYLVRCYFEDTDLESALSEIAGKAALYCWEEAGSLFLKAYTGAVGTSVKTITDASLRVKPAQYEAVEVIPKVTARWGWQERVHDLYYETEDQAVTNRLNIMGSANFRPPTEELDFTWGEAVASEQGDMVKTIADLLLTRLKLPRLRLEVEGFLDLARLQLGDAVTLDDDDYEVYLKSVRMTRPYGVGLGLVRFLGE